MTDGARDKTPLEHLAEAKRRSALGAGPRGHVEAPGWTPQAVARFIADAKHMFEGSYEPVPERRWRR